MGIYPEYGKGRPEPTPDGGTQWIETRSEPGVEYSRIVTTTKWEETKRDDCFCCSCEYSDSFGQVFDPVCRNHGWYGSRPCETHNMPGQADDEGIMPASVQQARASRVV